MKKYLAFCLTLFLVMTLTVFVQSEDENILIAYFTWADNTVVEDQEAALNSALAHYESVGDSGSHDEVDAIASASLVPPGNAARIAGWIQEEIGGDLFSIRVQEPYPSDYDDCMDRASEELAENARPALEASIEDMSQYDTVFIGYPNWWYSCPMAIHSFIEEYDLSGKKIVLFCTHGTGGIARSAADILESLPEDCEVEENVLGVYRSEITRSQNAVLEWLSDIGYAKRDTEENGNMNQQITVKAENGDVLVFALNDTPNGDLYELGQIVSGLDEFSELSGELRIEKVS